MKGDAQCGQVYPVWRAIGWVQWSGAPERERLMMIEYHRCTRAGVRAERNGFVGSLCEDHGHPGVHLISENGK